MPYDQQTCHNFQIICGIIIHYYRKIEISLPGSITFVKCRRTFLRRRRDSNPRKPKGL